MDISVAAEAVSAEIDGGTVVLTPDMRFVNFDAMGGVIWNLVTDGHDVDGVVGALCERYEVDRSTAEQDVRGFLQRLADLGIVTLSR